MTALKFHLQEYYTKTLKDDIIQQGELKDIQRFSHSFVITSCLQYNVFPFRKKAYTISTYSFVNYDMNCLRVIFRHKYRICIQG